MRSNRKFTYGFALVLWCCVSDFLQLKRLKDSSVLVRYSLQEEDTTVIVEKTTSDVGVGMDVDENLLPLTEASSQKGSEHLRLDSAILEGWKNPTVDHAGNESSFLPTTTSTEEQQSDTTRLLHLDSHKEKHTPSSDLCLPGKPPVKPLLCVCVWPMHCSMGCGPAAPS